MVSPAAEGGSLKGFSFAHMNVQLRNCQQCKNRTASVSVLACNLHYCDPSHSVGHRGQTAAYVSMYRNTGRAYYYANVPALSHVLRSSSFLFKTRKLRCGRSIPSSPTLPLHYSINLNSSHHNVVFPEDGSGLKFRKNEDLLV